MGMIGLGAAALVVDRTFLLPASATAGPVPGAPTGAVAMDGVTPTPSAPSQPRADLRGVSAQLAAAADRVGYDRGNVNFALLPVALVVEPETGREVPVVPGLPVEDPAPDLALSSVMPKASRALAVINGATVHVGGEIPGTGWSLVSVGDASVVVANGQRTHQIRLPRP